jgi:hypothetical protein
MSYILQSDFKKIIQTDNLNQIIGSDLSVLAMAELIALDELKFHLTQRFDLTLELTDVNIWNVAQTYQPFNRVFLNPAAFDLTLAYSTGTYVTYSANVYKSIAGSAAHAFALGEWTLIGIQFALYSAVYPYPVFSFKKQYALGDKVFWLGKVYTCLTATASISQTTFLQYRQIQSLPLSNVQPDNVDTGFQFWGTGVPYSVPVSTDILNTVYWSAGDTRDQLIVMWLIDITLYHLHSRIAPRNVPDLRLHRYNEAIKQLEAAADGKGTIKAPLIQPATGGRIRFGGNLKNINTY